MSLKDLEKFVRHFVLKSVQVIVQSRLGSQPIATQCNPKGNDWFNLAIHDIKDINEQTKKCMESIGAQLDADCDNKQTNNSFITVRNDWKICCEISLKTTEGNSMILEYWFVSNESIEDNNETQSQANGPTLIIYNIYNRMSLMLKSLISLTRSTPAFKLSCRGQSADSYVICYRVYRCDSENHVFKSEEETEHFSSVKQLGSIRSAFNELYVSFIYRTDMTIASKTASDNITNTSIPKSPQLMPLKSDHFKREERLKHIEDRDPSKPLTAAFAVASNTNSESLTLLPDAPFSKLLLSKDTTDSSKKTFIGEILSAKVPLKSEPIFIPTKSNPIENSIASSPVYSSSGDSFVFVELKAPFAPEEQHELGSFFNGPSPTFTCSGGDSTGDLSELTVKLAELESNAQQWDSFVESICLTENEDEVKTEI